MRARSMKSATFFPIVMGIFASITLSFPLLSLAQDEGEDEADSGLEEVLVTATRRGETNILDMPLSITALSGEETEKFALRDLSGISVDIPGLSSANAAGFNSAHFAMRGITETSIILYKESPVGVTLDEFVLQSMQTMNAEMFDIEAVEVLRGPQGTLFGKNTTGGVINVRSNRPVYSENSAEFRFHYGAFETNKANFVLNVGNDDLAFRLAGMALTSEGYYTNGAVYGPIAGMNTEHIGESGTGNGAKIGGDDVLSLRAKLLWEADENTNVLLSYEVVRDEGDSPPIVATNPPGYVFTFWGYGAATGDPLDQAGSTLRNNGNGINIQQGNLVDVDGVYLNIDHAINDDLTLYANAGIREQKSRLPTSYGGAAGPIALFDATRDDDRKTRQVELRIGSDKDGPFNYTAGVFYQDDDTDFCVMQTPAFLDGFFLGTPPDFFDENPLILCNIQRAQAKAVYFDGTWEVNDKLDITFGARYSEEDKDWAGRPRINLFLLEGAPTIQDLGEPLAAADFTRFPAGVVRDSHSWSEPTYRLIFGYDFSDETFGFFGYSRGFKSGGYNDQVGTQLNPITSLAAQPTRPEIADSFEGGIKHTFAGGDATISVNAYYVEYEDAQRTVNVTFPTGGQETLFFNAAQMEVMGIEAEGAWAVSDNYELRYNISWMDADYASFVADTNYDGVDDIDLSDEEVTRAPELMGGISGTYSTRWGDWNVDWNLRVAYEDDSISTYSDFGPAFHPILEARTLWDTSISFTPDQGNFYLKLVGQNLSDERYRTGSLSVATLWIMNSYGAPRYWGGEFGIRF